MLSSSTEVIMDDVDLSTGVFAISGGDAVTSPSSPHSKPHSDHNSNGLPSNGHPSHSHPPPYQLTLDEHSTTTVPGVQVVRRGRSPSSLGEAAEHYQVGGGELVDLTMEELVAHCHSPRPQPDNVARNQLIAVSVLCFFFMVAEIVGGLLSNSIALISDATHMASDLAGFMVSLTAIWMAKKKPSARLSFGFYRTEIVGALISILIIWLATAILVFFAVDRILHPSYDIKANDMLIVAGLGVGFNIVMGLVLHSGLCKSCSVPHSHFGGGHGHSHGHSHGNHSHMHGSNESLDRLTDQSHPPPQNINVRAALIHVIGDLVQSVGVLIAAIIIKVEPKYKIADPICTFIFSALVLVTTVTVLRDILLVIMEAVPRNFNYAAMKSDLDDVYGVQAVHSLNVWSLTMDKVVVAVHLAIGPDVEWELVVKDATKLLRGKYHVFQSTVQVEPYKAIMSSCEQCRVPPPSQSSCCASIRAL